MHRGMCPHPVLSNCKLIPSRPPPRLPRKYSDRNRDASATIVGTSGSTPLHFAAANGNKNIIQILLVRGAHPDRADKHNVTPEMLARQHGWVECAELLKTWAENKDRDLRDREPLGEDQQVTFGFRERKTSTGVDPEGSRRRLQVKRSIDNALNNILKNTPSTSSTPDLLRLRTQSPSSSTLLLSTHTPPISPTRGLGGQDADDLRHTPSPSPIDYGSRRPSLPYIFTSPRPSKPNTLVKSTKRPRSAGNGAEREDNQVLSNARGPGGRVLNPKYSLINMFKKGQGDGLALERTTSHQASASLSIPSLASTTSLVSSYGLSSSPKASDMVFPASVSSASLDPARPSMRAPTTSDASQRQQVSELKASPSPPAASPSVYMPPFASSRTSKPSAVDLHNILAQQQGQVRDRSGSSGSMGHFEVPSGLGVSFDDGSGPSRPSRSRPSGHGHLRDRSGSGASLNAASKFTAVFEDESGSPPSKSPQRPGILRPHSRSTSIGQGGVPRALRFDSSSSQTPSMDSATHTHPLRGSNSSNSLVRFKDTTSPNPVSTTTSPGLQVPEIALKAPESAPATITEFTHPELDGREADVLHENTTSSGRTNEALDPISPSRGDPMKRIYVDTSRPKRAVSGLSSSDNRARGDSLSSTSTSGSRDNPYLSTSGTSSGGSVAVNTPVLAPGADPYITLPDTSLTANEKVSEDPRSITYDSNGGITERRGTTPLDIDMSLISSHEQAEALVMRAQQDILDLAHSQTASLPSSEGWTPLSARLAAYGESLALEKKLRDQRIADGHVSPIEATEYDNPAQLGASIPTTPSGVSVNRQFSLGHRHASTADRTRHRTPRRPHTASGVTSIHRKSLYSSTRQNSLDVFAAPNAPPERTSSRQALTHVRRPSRSAPLADPLTPIVSGPDSPIAPYSEQDVTHHRSQTNDRRDLSRSSSLDDTELGPPLARVTTGPSRSATKLARMGFTPSDASRPQPQTAKRSKLKTLIQSLKSKP